MKVSKTAFIKAGTGTVLEIMEALREFEGPSDAKVISIKDDYSEAAKQMMITGEVPFNGDGSVGICVLEMHWVRDETGYDL